MTPVFQDRFMHTHGTGNCFNACVASLYDLPLCEVDHIHPHSPGVWFLNWRTWFKDKGLCLDITSKDYPPSGYTIVSCETERVYPDSHERGGEAISHACISLDGKIVHDPYPGGLETSTYVINYYYVITPFSDEDDF